MNGSVIDKVDKVLEISKKYSDVIGGEAADLQSEYQLPEGGELEKTINGLKEKNRLLRIGIIGKVKAGKSSLLNSVLFNGRNLLPKAATPMTASLAVISHGGTFGARIEYFSREDILKIREKAEEYQRLLDRALAELRKDGKGGFAKSDSLALSGKSGAKDAEDKTLLKEARKRVKSPALEAAFDHYERMRKSGLLKEFMADKSPEIVSAASESEFLAALPEYLGSNGKKMPFTRSVELCFPQDNLKELAIIDTPGLDDPVPSRSERTNQYLSQCDVVLVVSTAGEFLTDEDINLMDRLGKRDGLGEIYLLASQTDLQLSAQSVVEECEGDFPLAYKTIQKDLSSHAREHLKKIVREEVGAEGQFGLLADKKGSQVLLTSAAAYALAQQFDDRKAWDDTLKKVYELLRKNYPDYFEDRESAQASLGTLAGVGEVWRIFQNARLRKDEILSKRLEGIMAGVQVKLEGYLKDLGAMLREKIHILETTDKAELEKQRLELEQSQKNGSAAVEGAFDDAMDMFRANLRGGIESKKTALFEKTRAQVKDEEFERTKTRRWTTGWWIFKKHHSENYTVPAIHAGAVRNYLNSLNSELEENLQAEVEQQVVKWKNGVQAAIARALRETVDVEMLNMAAVKSAIRRQVNSLEIPRIDLSQYLFKDSTTGVLEAGAAERYLDKALDHLTQLRQKANELSREFIRELDESARQFRISDLLFADLNRELRNLEELLETKNASLKRLKSCEEELADVR